MRISLEEAVMYRKYLAQNLASLDKVKNKIEENSDFIELRIEEWEKEYSFNKKYLIELDNAINNAIHNSPPWSSGVEIDSSLKEAVHSQFLR